MDDRDQGVMSRRDAIMGALALAAGTLIAAQPDVALASNGQTLTAGNMFYTSNETIVHLSPTPAIPDPSSTIISSAILNRNGAFGGPIQAVYGSVDPGASAGSVGVEGMAWGPGLVGMHAQHWQSAGIALRVVGKAQFSRSGKRTIPKGKSVLTVSGVANIETTSMIMVTLQNSGGSGVYLKYAQRVSSTSFKVSLSRACASPVTFAWMIVD